MVEKVSLPKAQYADLRLPSRDRRGKLVARYDPLRGILEIQDSGMKYYFDLTQCPITVEAVAIPQREEKPEF